MKDKYCGGSGSWDTHEERATSVVAWLAEKMSFTRQVPSISSSQNIQG